MAAKFGAEREDVLKMQEISSKVVTTYHQYQMVHEWMGDQILSAIYKRETPSNYPDFILKSITTNKVRINLNQPGHAHSREYLESYLRFRNSEIQQEYIIPPTDYFRSSKELYKAEIKSELEGNSEVYNKFKLYANSIKFIRPIIIKELSTRVTGLVSDQGLGPNIFELRDKVRKQQTSFKSKCDEAAKRYK